MGGSVQDSSKAYDTYAKGVAGNIAKGDLNAMATDSAQSIGTSLDPGGLFIKSDNQSLIEAQSFLDIGGLGAKNTATANKAQTEADKQKALIDAQQAKIDAELKKQEAVTEERKKRMAQNQLLSGKESGATSLLGAK
jgi:hypothetical protein